MAEMRWLLQISIAPEPKVDIPVFLLRLRNLDDPAETPPVSVRTVDELVAVLVEAWHHRLPPPSAPST